MNKIEKMIVNINYADDYLKMRKYLSLCPIDCSACCYDYFYVTLPEFYLTLYGLQKIPTNLEYYHQKALVTFKHFNNHYRNEVKRLMPSAASLLENVTNDFSEGEYVNYPNLPSCVMLNNGRCSIYKYRPNTCRKYGTTITCELINNIDYQNDSETNYNLYPLIKNTQLITSDDMLINTHKYPLWFCYGYFMQKKFRPFILKNLQLMMSISEEEYIELIAK